MKKKILGLLMTGLLASVLALSACGGDDTTTSSTTSKTSSSTASTTLTTSKTSTTSSTSKTTTSTTSSLSSSSSSTTLSTTSTTSKTTTPTTTSTTTSTTATTSSESLMDILGNYSGIDSVYYEMEMTSNDGTTQTSEIWIKGNKMRMEMTAEGESVVYIYDGDALTTYIYYPSMGMVMQTTYEPQESAADETEGITDYNPTILGTETYDGKVCLVIQYTYEGATTKMWIWKEYGFPVKIEVTSSEGTYVIVYKNIVFNSVTDDMFVLPDGLTTVTY